MNIPAFVGNMRMLLAQKLTPVKKNRILFTSFGGHYSDNPKYISQKMHEVAPGAELVWLVKKQYMHLLPEYVTAVDIEDAAAARRCRATACAIVDNVYGEKETNLYEDTLSKRLLFALNSFLKNKQGQRVYTTWHGTPLKRMGRDQHGSTVLDFSSPRTTMILGNQYTLDIMRHLTFGKIQMELIGTPRNDVLFSDKTETEKIKRQMGLPLNKKILLFAPTFRNDANGIADTNIRRSGLDQMQEMDPERLVQALSSRFGGDWVLVCRFHYHVEAQVDWERLENTYPGCFINGNAHDDMAQYLCCADVLLTDASSSMYDFALTGRPCFLFFPDLDHYANQERGFYTQIEELPFPVSTTFGGLLDCISSFDADSYGRQVRQMLSDYGYADDANSSERVAKYIFGQINKHE